MQNTSLLLILNVKVLLEVYAVSSLYIIFILHWIFFHVVSGQYSPILNACILNAPTRPCVVLDNCIVFNVWPPYCTQTHAILYTT